MTKLNKANWTSEIQDLNIEILNLSSEFFFHQRERKGLLSNPSATESDLAVNFGKIREIGISLTAKNKQFNLMIKNDSKKAA